MHSVRQTLQEQSVLDWIHWRNPFWGTHPNSVWTCDDKNASHHHHHGSSAQKPLKTPQLPSVATLHPVDTLSSWFYRRPPSSPCPWSRRQATQAGQTVLPSLPHTFTVESQSHSVAEGDPHLHHHSITVNRQELSNIKLCRASAHSRSQYKLHHHGIDMSFKYSFSELLIVHWSHWCLRKFQWLSSCSLFSVVLNLQGVLWDSQLFESELQDTPCTTKVTEEKKEDVVVIRTFSVSNDISELSTTHITVQSSMPNLVIGLNSQRQ